MTSRQTISKRSLVPHRPRAVLLTWGFWVLTLALILHQLLVVIPAYYGGLLPAYYAGWALKDISFSVPIYTSSSLVMAILAIPVLLLIAFVSWVAPVLTIIWGVGVWQAWHRIPARTKWSWPAIILVLWGLTLLTKTASTAFTIWLLD
jgi:hypothetical protein